MSLSTFIEAFAAGMGAADARYPQAANARTGVKFKPGIGPHTESRTVDLALAEMVESAPAAYLNLEREVPYPTSPRSKCDVRVRLGDDPWAIEVKMLRMMGDNGKPNDNILMHILSPYPSHRSALTDCGKLLDSGFEARKAIVIFGYDYPDFPMDPALRAFETLAREVVHLSGRVEAGVVGLVHPVHQAARVVGWEVTALPM